MNTQQSSVIATLCYLRQNGKTLMLHRNKRKDDYHYGKWNGLGGKLEKGESPEECVIREVREESGLTIADPLLNGFITFPNFDGQNDWHVFIYTVSQFEGKLEDSEEGTLEWVKDEEIINKNLWEADHIFIPWLDNNQFFCGKFIYQNSHYVKHTVNFRHLA